MELRAGNMFIATAIFFVAASSLVVAIEDAKQRRMVCHYTTLSQNRAGDASYRVENIPGDLCTHVVYNYIGIDDDKFILKPLQREIDIVQNAFGRFGRLKKKYPHLKISLAVGGWAVKAEKFSKMAEYRRRRKNFVKSVVLFLEKFGFDGLELAWYYPGDTKLGGNDKDNDNLIYLVEDLKKAFDSIGKGWEVTVQAPADITRLAFGYEIDALCDLADYVHLIGYDMRGSWNSFADVHGPMAARPHDQGNFRTNNVRDGVDHWIKNGCRPSKMILGVALNGRSYTLANPQENALGAPTSGPAPAGRYTYVPGYISYFEICLKFRATGANWRQLWDDVGMCPYAYEGTEWIGYENERSLAEKIELAKQKQLAGIFAFSLDLDDYRGDCGGEKYPLTRTLYKYIEEVKEDSGFAAGIDRVWGNS